MQADHLALVHQLHNHAKHMDSPQTVVQACLQIPMI